jgi:hypothetical protein
MNMSRAKQMLGVSSSGAFFIFDTWFWDIALLRVLSTPV